ncbi:MAG: adenosylcobinamide-phosphate synthase CbiB [Thermoplasmata archaeon]
MIWYLIFVIAVLVDLIIEYPNIIHPVAWIGKFINFFDKRRKKRGHMREFADGTVLIIVTILLASLFLYLITKIPNYWIRFIIYIYVLKSTFSIGALIRHVRKCSTDNIETLRHNVSMIVSRDVNSLDNEHLYSAAIESGAENIVDSVIGPMFYFLLFGIFGAVIYRIINTADAMIGYRSEKYEYFGKFAARADDVLNFVPARILGAFLVLYSKRRVLDNYRAYKKLKINGMYSIAGFAALLNLTLEKPGYYKIPGAKYPDMNDIKKAIGYIAFFSYLFVFIVLIILVIINGSISWWS